MVLKPISNVVPPTRGTPEQVQNAQRITREHVRIAEYNAHMDSNAAIQALAKEFETTVELVADRLEDLEYRFE